MQNREIKFRVWTGNEMEHKVMAGFLGNFFVQGMDEKDSACVSGMNTKYPENYPIMQFTGLKDINGKEIYEGDIVRFKSWRDALQRMEEKKMTVKFERGFFIPLVSFGDDPSNRDYEIIGNIYQNKELG